MFPVSKILCSVSYVLYPAAVSYILWPVSCFLYNYVLCLVSSSPYSVSGILYPVSCILYPLFCILYPLSCSVGKDQHEGGGLPLQARPAPRPQECDSGHQGDRPALSLTNSSISTSANKSLAGNRFLKPLCPFLAITFNV